MSVVSLDGERFSRYLDNAMHDFVASGASKLEAFTLVACISGAAVNGGDPKDYRAILVKAKRIFYEAPNGPKKCPFIDELMAELTLSD